MGRVRIVSGTTQCMGMRRVCGEAAVTHVAGSGGVLPQKIVVSMDSETFFQAISQCNFQNFNQTTMFSLFSNKGQDFLLRKIIIMIQQTECR